jgi:hypothetical protein
MNEPGSYLRAVAPDVLVDLGFTDGERTQRAIK